MKRFKIELTEKQLRAVQDALEDNRIALEASVYGNDTKDARYLLKIQESIMKQKQAINDKRSKEL